MFPSLFTIFREHDVLFLEIAFYRNCGNFHFTTFGMNPYIVLIISFSTRSETHYIFSVDF